MSESSLARELEARLDPGETLHLQSTRLVHGRARYGNVDFNVLYEGIPYGESFKVIKVECSPRGPSDSPPPAPEDDEPTGAKARAATAAIAALWPEGVPDLTFKELARDMLTWIKDRGKSVPSDRTMERALATARAHGGNPVA